ncbi:MAG: outer membrane beta-barrel protein [Bacteroidetes bacterium]|nr:outer membrane beta-barrel protein [Bacteroidota bacterium]
MKTLKNIALTALAGALMIPAANAQFYLGARTGINMAKMNTNVAGAIDNSIIGILGGATTRYQFTNHFSACGDALFSQFGNNQKYTIDIPGASQTTETKTTVNYLQIPLYINYEIPFKPKDLVPYRVHESFVSGHLYGGGYFGYALGANQSVTTTTITDAETVVSPTVSGAVDKKNFNAMDFGIMAGVGLSFRLDQDKRQRLFLDFRYMMGMADFDASKEGSATNSAMAISIAYSYKMTARKYTTRHRF